MASVPVVSDSHLTMPLSASGTVPADGGAATWKLYDNKILHIFTAAGRRTVRLKPGSTSDEARAAAEALLGATPGA